MDYVVGSVAALISGNASTPNRPRIVKRALTPVKRQQSPNVTPKSEFVDDRSIFLSPSVQKKKAIVKKSPKRIFENPDMDVTNEGDGEPKLISPKADKVKKHLKNELESNSSVNISPKSPKSPKKRLSDSIEQNSLKKQFKMDKAGQYQVKNENTPKMKKQGGKSATEDHSSNKVVENVTVKVEKPQNESKNRKRKNSDVQSYDNEISKENSEQIEQKQIDTPSKISRKKQNKSKNNNKQVTEPDQDKKPLETETSSGNVESKTKKKRNKKSKKTNQNQQTDIKETQLATEPNKTNKPLDTETSSGNVETKSKKKRNKKSKKSNQNQKTNIKENQPTVEETVSNDTDTDVSPKAFTNEDTHPEQESDDGEGSDDEVGSEDEASEEEQDGDININPNAITNEDSDSEHESDDEIESETEQANNEILDTGPVETSDEEEEETPKPKGIEKKEKAEKPEEVNKEEEVKRTLFVGNVPFSAKCKKEIKKIFSKYGTIETVRIRTVPVKDARVTPKLAVIKNELHPERTTVNVYVKFQDPSSVNEALRENNVQLNGCHLRVSRSDTTGAEHDPKFSVFVGNLPFAIEDETLRTKFESCGQIESVRIIRDKKTNAGKGFGYVNFASKDGVELALNLSEEDLTIKNRILRVKRCTQTANKKANRQTNGRNQGRSQGQAQRNFDNNRGNSGNNRFGNRDGNNRHGNNNGNNRFANNDGNNKFGNNNGNNRFANKDGNNKFGNNGNNRFANKDGNNRFGNRDSNNRFGNRDSNNRFGNRDGNNRFGNRDGNNRFGNRDGNNRFGNDNNVANEKFDGAFRRLQNKRQNQEGGGDGPQPKKQRKEFVGMTAEKKKKRTFDKGQKKKKALSEILTK